MNIKIDTDIDSLFHEDEYIIEETIEKTIAGNPLEFPMYSHNLGDRP